MKVLTDAQLLADFVHHGSETAFAELVSRQVDLVYSVALRLVKDNSLAEDVAQGVFLALARNAARLQQHPTLTGWLHRTTQNIALQTIRTENRRRHREQVLINQSPLSSAESESVWEVIAPQLDAALNALSEKDREVTLLRFFEKKTAAEIALLIGSSEDAVQKRAQRSLEQLRRIFARQGITAGATGLAGVISAQAVQTAPAGVAATLTASALAGMGTKAATKIVVLATLQKWVVWPLIPILLGTLIYEACELNRTKSQNQILQQTETSLQVELNRFPPAAPALNAPSKASMTIVPKEVDELGKLHREKAALQEKIDLVAEKTQAAQKQWENLTNASRQFLLQQTLKLYQSKLLAHALQIWANDHNGRYPQNVRELTNRLDLSADLGSRMASLVKNFDPEIYEFISSENPSLKGDHNKYAVAKERLSHQAPDGRWERFYIFADGNVQKASSSNGDFGAWESANTDQALMVPAN